MLRSRRFSKGWNSGVGNFTSDSATMVTRLLSLGSNFALVIKEKEQFTNYGNETSR